MSIHRLNHAVLYVRNVERSVAFYRDILDFTPISAYSGIPGAAFLRAAGSTNDHDLGLFQIAPTSSAVVPTSGVVAPTVGPGASANSASASRVGLYHLAWEVDTLADLESFARRLADAGALVGASDHGTTKSLYGHDPDGLEFELAWIVPADLLDDETRNSLGVRPLDLQRETSRYGADTPGGVGISRPAPVR